MRKRRRQGNTTAQNTNYSIEDLMENEGNKYSAEDPSKNDEKYV
jgi:hypothetical protein